MDKLTLEKIKELTMILKNPSTAYYDQLEDVIHSFEPGEIIIATRAIDDSTYYIKYDNEQFEVSKKKASSRNHNTSILIPASMREDDYRELERLWESMYIHCMAVQKLSQTDIRLEWSRLIDLLPNTEIPYKPKISPSKTNRTTLLRSLNKLFIKLKLVVEFEWKEWSDGGLIELNHFLEASGLNIPTPTDIEKNCVAESVDFERSIINLIQKKLSAIDKTIFAIEPLDEFQTFIIIPTEIAPRVLEILTTFTVLTISSKP